MSELLRMYHELYDSKIDYCVICMRSSEERRMVELNTLKTLIYSNNMPFKYTAATQKICYICECMAKAAHQFLLAVNLSGSVHKLYNTMGCSQLSYKDIENQLLGLKEKSDVTRHSEEWVRRLNEVRANGVLQRSEMMVNSNPMVPTENNGAPPANLQLGCGNILYSINIKVEHVVEPEQPALEILAENEVIPIANQEPEIGELTIDQAVETNNLTFEPIHLESVISEPTLTLPTLTEPTYTEPMLSEPTLTETTFTEPMLTEPTLTETTFTEPMLTETTFTETTFTEPTFTETTFTEPTLTKTTFTEPTVTETTFTEPGLSEHGLSESMPIEPQQTESVLSKLSLPESIPNEPIVRPPQDANKISEIRLCNVHLEKFLDNVNTKNLALVPDGVIQRNPVKPTNYVIHPIVQTKKMITVPTLAAKVIKGELIMVGKKLKTVSPKSTLKKFHRTTKPKKVLCSPKRKSITPFDQSTNLKFRLIYEEALPSKATCEYEKVVVGGKRNKKSNQNKKKGRGMKDQESSQSDRNCTISPETLITMGKVARRADNAGASDSVKGVDKEIPGSEAGLRRSKRRKGL